MPSKSGSMGRLGRLLRRAPAATPSPVEKTEKRGGSGLTPGHEDDGVAVGGREEDGEGVEDVDLCEDDEKHVVDGHGQHSQPELLLPSRGHREERMGMTGRW